MYACKADIWNQPREEWVSVDIRWLRLQDAHDTATHSMKILRFADKLYKYVQFLKWAEGEEENDLLNLKVPSVAVNEITVRMSTSMKQYSRPWL